MQTTHQLEDGSRLVITDVDADGTDVVEFEVAKLVDPPADVRALDPRPASKVSLVTMPRDALDALAMHDRKKAGVVWFVDDHGEMIERCWWGDARGKIHELDDIDERYAKHIYEFVLYEAPRYYSLAWALFLGRSKPRLAERVLPQLERANLGEIRYGLQQSPLMKALLDKFEPKTLEELAREQHRSRVAKEESRRAENIAVIKTKAAAALRQFTGMDVDENDLRWHDTVRVESMFWRDRGGVVLEATIPPEQGRRPYICVRRNYGGSLRKPAGGVSDGPGSRVQVLDLASLGSKLERWPGYFIWSQGEFDAALPPSFSLSA